MDLSQLIDSVNRQYGVWAWPAGIVGLAVVFILAMWMGAALANLEKLTFLRALWLGPVMMVVVAAAGYGIFLVLYGADMSLWTQIDNLLFGLVFVLILDLVLVFGLAKAVGSATNGQGLLMWVFQLPILVLLGSLVGGGVFVTIAIYQASQEPNGQTWLTLIGWLFAGIMALGIALFFITRFSQQGPVRPTQRKVS